MIKFLKVIFSSSGDVKGNAEPVTEYKGFNIQPTPQEASGGWSTEAIISKEIDAEVKTHHFIRADKSKILSFQSNNELISGINDWICTQTEKRQKAPENWN